MLETPLDPECRAFSLALTDTFFSTIDWANAQSSLNRRQAVVDADGILRVVVASADPGVHNWLDTTGHRSGVLQFRWSGTKAAPDFSVRTVAADALADALPAGGRAHHSRATRRRDPRPADRRAAARVLVGAAATWGSRRRRRPK